MKEFVRFDWKPSKQALAALDAACRRREELIGRPVCRDEILNDLLMRCLPEPPADIPKRRRTNKKALGA
jgi:hypothetical protein